MMVPYEHHGFRRPTTRFSQVGRDALYGLLVGLAGRTCWSHGMTGVEAYYTAACSDFRKMAALRKRLRLHQASPMIKDRTTQKVALAITKYTLLLSTF